MRYITLVKFLNAKCVRDWAQLCFCGTSKKGVRREMKFFLRAAVDEVDLWGLSLHTWRFLSSFWPVFRPSYFLPLEPSIDCVHTPLMKVCVRFHSEVFGVREQTHPAPLRSPEKAPSSQLTHFHSQVSTKVAVCIFLSFFFFKFPVSLFPRPLFRERCVWGMALAPEMSPFLACGSSNG